MNQIIHDSDTISQRSFSHNIWKFTSFFHVLFSVSFVSFA